MLILRHVGRLIVSALMNGRPMAEFHPPCGAASIFRFGEAPRSPSRTAFRWVKGSGGRVGPPAGYGSGGRTILRKVLRKRGAGHRRRAWGLRLAAAILVLGFICDATLLIAVRVWTSAWGQTDRIAALGDVFAAGGLALALVAAVVAILAYGVSIEEPDILALLSFPGSDTNEPVLMVDPSRPVGGEVDAWVLATFTQVNCAIRLDNRSAFSGRNPVVRIELMNMWNLKASGYWLPVSAVTPGAKAALRWSGAQVRSVTSVHGSDIADIDTLSFDDVVASKEGPHEIVVIVLAEGFKRTQRIPVVLQTPSDWRSAHPHLVETLPTHLRS